ncbi:SufB Cysteine desulfurase activator SufB [actinobacterium SCGC AAA044-D11]
MSTLTTNYLAPSGREEAWRFTPLSRLGGLLDASVNLESANSISLVKNIEGVKFSVKSAEDLPAISVSDDSATIRARESITQVTHIEVAKDANLSEPILLERTSLNGNPQASRTLISAGVNSHATIILQNTGNAILADEIEFDVAPGANLTFVSLQEWDAKTVHLGRQHAVVSKDAEFNSIVVTVGGSLVRLLPTVEYSGPGSSADLQGLYFATDGQHLEHRLFVNHNVPNAKSRVNYKGALAGDKAHTVWIGDVYIRANAEGTDTYELNRNLLLSDGARADSVPNLEIETGEIVGAGHASTTGRFDDEQLFYLSSRGIPAEIARRLVVRGFFAEIVGKIKNEEIENRLMDRIDAELAKVGA